MSTCITTKRAATPPAEGAAILKRRGPGRSGRARRGKIARLPNSIREELNERLLDGHPAADILPWLNALCAPTGHITYRAPHTADGHADRCTALALALRAADDGVALASGPCIVWPPGYRADNGQNRMAYLRKLDEYRHGPNPRLMAEMEFSKGSNNWTS